MLHKMQPSAVVSSAYINKIVFNKYFLLTLFYGQIICLFSILLCQYAADFFSPITSEKPCKILSLCL